jgi:DNA-binding SARP family transcriptional activator/TolB-like protein
MTGSKHKYLRLLGRFAVGIVGEGPMPISIRSKKGAALLAFLAMQPEHRVSRDEIATLLWGDRHDRQARQSLRQCLVSLRADLAPFAHDLMVFHRDQIGLATQSLTVDVDELARLAECDELVDLERGLDLYRGPFLADCKLDLETLTNWLRAERERIDQIAARVFRACVDRYDAQGNGAKAINTAKRLVALDPFREDWQRRLLALCARYQGAEAAAAHAKSLIKRLREELDVDPAPQTRALVAQIERGSVSVQIGAADLADVFSVTTNAPPHHSIIADYRRGKPSLVVLPFLAVDADKDLTDLAANVTEECLTRLTRNKSFCVLIVEGSCDRAADFKRIAAELGAEYALVGAVRRANRDIRLTARLLDAQTGAHVWAQRYTHELRSGFAGLDAITASLAAAIELDIYAAEQDRLRHMPLRSLGAGGCLVAALGAIKKRTRQNYAMAEGLLKRAMMLDPSCARAHAVYAWVVGFSVLSGWKSRAQALPLALDAANQAVVLDAHDYWARFALGWALTQNRLPEGGIDEYRRAIDINPYFSVAHSCLGLALAYVSQTEKAETVMEDAERLRAPEIFVGQHKSCLAGVCFGAERHRDAMIAARRSVQEYPGPICTQRQLVVNSVLAGETQEARAAFATFKGLAPDLSLNSVAATLPYIRDKDLNKVMDAFRLIGLR